MKRSELYTFLDGIRSRQRVVRYVDLASGESRTVQGLPADIAALVEHLPDSQGSRAGVIDDGHGSHTYVEVREPCFRLILIGAVHISQALLPIAHWLGYETFVIDPRSAFATKARFPDTNIDHRWPEEAMKCIGVDEQTAICALTHDPKIDDPALCFALASNAFYVGALGSRRTHRKRIARLEEFGVDEAALARVHAPIGLNIGAVGETEIALSIIAEITETARLGLVSA